MRRFAGPICISIVLVLFHIFLMKLNEYFLSVKELPSPSTVQLTLLTCLAGRDLAGFIAEFAIQSRLCYCMKCKLIVAGRGAGQAKHSPLCSSSISSLQTSTCDGLLLSVRYSCYSRDSGDLCKIMLFLRETCNFCATHSHQSLLRTHGGITADTRASLRKQVERRSGYLVRALNN